MSKQTRATPMMAQWHKLKKEAKDALLFFRLGDFYEAFYEDAKVISKKIGITLTQRQNIPMCGVPFHASETYLDKLLVLGFKIAIAEQVEKAQGKKGLVDRKIVRYVSPGTLIQSNLLKDKSNNFFVSISQVGKTFGICVIDLTTAECKTMEFDDLKEVENELFRLNPAEILVSKKFQKDQQSFFEELSYAVSFVLNTQENWLFELQEAQENLKAHFYLHNLDSFGLKGMLASIQAAGALFSYLKDDLKFSLDHIESIQVENVHSYLAIDRSTFKHLEIFDSSSLSTSTLLSLLDETLTAMGGRKIRKWIKHPLLDCREISFRQTAIQEFLEKTTTFTSFSSSLKKICDLERILMKIQQLYASPRDILNLANSLAQIDLIKKELCSFSSSFLKKQVDNLYDLHFLSELIQQALFDPAPLRLGDANVFKIGYNPELDDLKFLLSNGKNWIKDYQQKLREQTQIKTLKISYSRAFGYYIDVSKLQAKKIPDTFYRRQTLVNSERFVTEELKSYEEKIFSAEEKIIQLEAKLFAELREKIIGQKEKIKKTADALACIDVLFSLAKVALNYSYTRPKVDQSDQLEIKHGKHPILSKHLDHDFITNDTRFDMTQRLFLITGPNMAGKSTYIRQVALLVIMAQMGSFIPAEFAHIGIVDKIFSRIGASDDLARGQSTFMVEMSETANILNNATKHSLVILDEIGRGTSTYDGISIAWAVAEYLSKKQIKTLFATHYWELTDMEKKMQGVVNLQVAVKETQKGIVFLHKIIQGGTDKSYGIHVAKLAGLPFSVIQKAEDMLFSLENKPEDKKQKKFVQPSLFKEQNDPIKKQLASLDLNQMTPIEALQKLIEFQKTVKNP